MVIWGQTARHLTVLGMVTAWGWSPVGSTASGQSPAAIGPAATPSGPAAERQPAAPAGPLPTAAVGKAAAAKAADELVRQALRSRELGKSDAEPLLARALATDPGSESARWYGGYVREGKDWVQYAAVADGDAYRKLLDRYQGERLAHPNTLDGHAAVAEWCHEQKLLMQERAHWFKVLEFDTDHARARARLDYVRVGANWVTRREMENTRRREIAAQRAYKKWSAALRPIRTAFESNDPERMAAAQRKLAEFHDPEAIPAMEAVLSKVNLEAATAVVSVIRRMKGPEAAIGLARQAVFAEWYPVGKEAAEALRDRDELSYVPPMLSALAVPTGETFQVATYSGDGLGRLLVRYVFERERQDQTEKVSCDVSYGVWTPLHAPFGQLTPEQALAIERRKISYVPVLPGMQWPPPGTQQPKVSAKEYYGAVVRNKAEADRAQVSTKIEEETRTIKDINERICRALRTATSVPETEMTTNDPREWWDWWTDRTEVFIRGPKPVVYSKYTAQVIEEAPRYIPPTILVPYVPGRRGSCLVAGTTVYTDVGPRPVEQIRLGDRVLAQNVDTGELSYRVVLEPTVRPAAPTVVLKFGDKRIQATGGHPFWAVGRGWTKAREFEPGMRMATVAGTVEVTGIEPASAEPAYNLVVDEFHTYFVGDVLVLSHDNRPPEPARGGLPGMPSSP